MSKALELTPEEITAIRIRERLKGLPAKEIVKRWYMSPEPFELTEQEEHIRERWDWAKAQFLKRQKFGDIRDAMVAEFGIGPATAARDIREALDCFGDLDRVPMEAHRQRAIQMALSAFNAAKKDKDGKAMAAATRVYMEAAGLDKDDSKRIDIERMMSERVYVEALDPQVRNLLLNLIANSGGSTDMSKVFSAIYAAKDGEDFTDYETIPDNPGPDPA